MKLSVNKPQRLAKMRAHTATHLLHAEICKFLPNTKQLGSLVDEDLVRFDFAAENMLTNNQILEIEKNINSIIKSDNTVNVYEKNIADAKAIGAKAFFEDKYGDIVRVVCIGDNEQKSDQKLHLVFDFDGVLGDTFHEIIKARLEIGDYETIEEIESSTLKYSNNKPNHTKNHSLSKEEFDNMMNWNNRYAIALQKQNSKIFEQFVKDIIKISNVKLAIVSSGQKSYILPMLGEYAKRFEYIYDFHDSHSKEDKIDMVCKNWGINKSEIYYFTDTLADIYELETHIDKSQLVGCARGFSGVENLSKELPAEQIILEQNGLPDFMEKYIYKKVEGGKLNVEGGLISIELCGGTHVETTSQIGIFKIIGQQSVASGTKRITAYTGPKVMEYIYEEGELLASIALKLSCEPKQAPEKLEKVIKDLATANSQIESYKSGAAANISWQQVVKSNYTANIYILENNLTLKDVSNHLKGKEGNYIYADSNSGFVIYSSGKQAKIIQAELGVKGGGNDQMIQGKDESILEKLK